jgi:hypothetical protein
MGREVKSVRTRQFNKLFDALPADVQRDATEAYKQFAHLSHPYHTPNVKQRASSKEPVYFARFSGMLEKARFQSCSSLPEGGKTYIFRSSTTWDCWRPTMKTEEMCKLWQGELNE